jgi:methylated-DNA-[protein]-cysteine S-methyltransferase
MPFDWRRVTPFQRRVYEALLEVPPGWVTTYGRLASRIGCRSPRAVGQALGGNPFAPDVPCHRVIAGTHTAGGFNHAVTGPAIACKRHLLLDEGVTCDRSGRLADVSRIWQWDNVGQTGP